MKRTNRLLIVLCSAATLAFAACNDGDTIYQEPDPGVTRLNISPRSVTMGYADDVELLVAIRPVSTVIEWESSNPEIAYVDENNRIIPVSTGKVELTAHAGELSDKITATIHSSIVGPAYTFIDEGATSAIPDVQVLPEGTAYTVTSSNESAVTVGADNRITAAGAGISQLHIETEDNQSSDVTVGVIDDAHTLTGSAADAFSYDGGPLGHSAYNINVLALQAGGATYADGGTWSGSGTGLFLKLYTDVKYETIPAGTYTSGTGDFNYYTGGRSYIVDAESGTHYNINNGDVEITESGVSAKLITADNNAWSFTYSGTISETPHAYPYDSLTYDFTNDSFGSGTVAIDHNGTLFYGGYNNGWRFRLMEKEASSHYVQIVVWTEETDKLADTYPLNNGFCAKGTINIMGYGTTSLYYGGSNVYFNGGTEFKTPGFNREGNTVTVGFQGTFNANGSESVSEIGESRTVPITYNLDVTGFAFTVNSEAGA